METFFRDRQKVQEWVDLLIEKLFTVSLLSGNDVDSEFYRGKQAAEKIARFLQDITNLPKEALTDGIRQLVEQRLPDSRVIENFPHFYELMDEMIHAGLSDITPTLTPQNNNLSGDQPAMADAGAFPSTALSSKITVTGGHTIVNDSTACISLRHHLRKIGGFSFNTNTQNPSANESMDQSVKTLSDPGASVISMTPEASSFFEQKAAPKTSPVSEPEPVPEVLPVSEPEPAPEALPVSAPALVPEALPNSLADTGSILAPLHNELKQKEELEAVTVMGRLRPRDPFHFNARKVAKAAVNSTPSTASPAGTTAFSAKSSGVPVSSTQSSFSSQKETPVAKIPFVRNSQVPPDGQRLAFVLKQLYPNSTARWNVAIGRLTFYVQIDKLLIYILSSENHQENHILKVLDDLKNQGWVIYTCQKEDLAYPRRMERGIRSVLPKKKS